MVARAPLAQQATGRDACAHTLGQSRWKMSRTADDGEYAVMWQVESGLHFRQQCWHGTTGHALKNRSICDGRGVGVGRWATRCRAEPCSAAICAETKPCVGSALH